MIGSLYSGISGLKAQTSTMAVIGDNIANVNTTGFKSSRVLFANIFDATLGHNPLQPGRGVTLAAITSNWNTGTVENTNSVTDMAINGQGMFILRDSANSGMYYTRAGQFQFNNLNQLVNPDGLLAQGFAINPVTGTLGPMGNISLPNTISEPRATTEMSMGLNLDSGAAVGDTYDATLSVFDSLGNPIELNLNFIRTTDGWNWYVAPSAGSAVPPGPAVDPPVYGELVFDADGALIPGSCTPAMAAGDLGPTITVTGLAGNDLSVDWIMLGPDGASNGTVTGYSGASVRTSQYQNGYPSGMLQGISVDETGTFTALYSNGALSPFAQIALADFASYEGLSKQGNNLYTATLASGQAVVTTPNSAGVGSISPNGLEMSNVDLAQEFVALITAQRAFQANSRVITTSDEMLAELINIKR
jgi:flagellar hook protein FlgE